VHETLVVRNVPTWMRYIRPVKCMVASGWPWMLVIWANGMLILLSIIDALQACAGLFYTPPRPLSPPHGETGTSRAIDSALSHRGCKTLHTPQSTHYSCTNSHLNSRKWGPLGSVTTPCGHDNTTNPRSALPLLLLSFCSTAPA
jgi:hypothetical protein